MRRLLAGGLVIAYLAAPGLARAGTVAIFYYPWYGTPLHDGAWLHWGQNGHQPPADVYSRYFPATGPYSSGDPRVVARQMSEIAAAGVNEVVISWWGRGSAEDGLLPLVVAAARAHHLVPAIHVEPYAGRSPATVGQDLPYLASLGIRDVYVYRPRDFAASDWAGVTAQKPASMRIFAGTELVGFAVTELGPGRAVVDLRPVDFEQVRAKAAKRWGARARRRPRRRRMAAARGPSRACAR